MQEVFGHGLKHRNLHLVPESIEDIEKVIERMIEEEDNVKNHINDLTDLRCMEEICRNLMRQNWVQQRLLRFITERMEDMIETGGYSA